MFGRKFQFVVFVLVVFSVSSLQEQEMIPYNNPGFQTGMGDMIPLEEIQGNYTMTTDKKESMFRYLAEYLDTKPEDIEAIIEHPTVGNFEVKLLDRRTEEIEITVETLAGKTTDRLKPGGTGEFPWFDGRKFTVIRMYRFMNGMGVGRESKLSLRKLGKNGIGFTMDLRKDVGEFYYHIPKQVEHLHIWYKKNNNSENI